ncbi:MAG TPA: alpha/beta hydrolase-fold protein [Chitinophagaceae bacterium]|nr:alpha/beta hydrolase-fold protein [Chitinophagaceae bacterium]
MNAVLRYLPGLLMALLLPALLPAQPSLEFSVDSKHTGDKYIITIKYHHPSLKQHVVFVADGSLTLGHYILGTNKNWKAAVPTNCVIVAIAHSGDWHMKRRRDFIPADAGGHKDEEFGKSLNFYLFLKDELFPLINSKITNQLDRAFIGHSFSGLFSLYAALQTEKLFEKYFAISPSIWANYYELGKIEQQYFAKVKKLSGKLFLYAGSMEVFNKVLSSTINYYNTLKSRKYEGLSVHFTEIRNANHFSIIKPAVDHIFKSINN